MSESILTIVFFKSFIMSILTFRSLINFEFFFFVCVLREGVFLFYSFTCSCLVYLTPLIEEAVVSPSYIIAYTVID